MTTIGSLFAAILPLGSLAATALLARETMQRKQGTGLMLALGFLLVGIGEWWFGDSSARTWVSGSGMLIVIAAVGLRYWAFQNSTGGRKEGHQIALQWSGVAVVSLLLYALTLDPVTSRLGFEEEGLANWNIAWRTLFPMVALLGVLPALRVDQLLAVHPVIMPAGAASSAQLHGVTAALVISLMFPLNYLAKSHEMQVDVAYFRTTRPGESTKKIVSALSTPIDAVLFYPKGNEVAQELKGYFEALEQDSNGQFSYRIVDQAFDPKLAEDLKIRENGQIVLRSGDTNEKVKVDPDMDKAKSNLRKLDSLVQKSLLKLTKGPHSVYFVEGHGEANWREGENPFRKINSFKKDLEALNLKVKTLSVAEGLAAGVPEDAAIVVVASPTSPLLPEEVASLKAYWDRGGSMLLLTDISTDKSMKALLDHVGVDAGRSQLANAEAHLKGTGGPADNVLVATNKYGSHPVVKTLSRNSNSWPMVFPQAVWVQKAEATTNKVTTLVRTLPNTWEDTTKNFVADEGEQKKVYELAVAVTKEITDSAPAADAQPSAAPKSEGRAVVVGNVSFLSDPATQFQGNAQFARDAALWLDHDDEITGDVESEEDVKVQHTQEEDTVWFLTMIFFVPASVLGAGVLFIRMRRRN